MPQKNSPELEDALEDILMKSQAASELTQAELSQNVGCEITELRNLRRGAGSSDLIRRFADALQLDADKLLALQNESYPPEPALPSGWQAIRHPFGEGVVNAYLWTDRESAILFDTGTDADRILECLHQSNGRLQAIFLTHTHRDHVGGLAALRQTFPEVAVFSRGLPPLEPYTVIDADPWKATVAGMEVRARAVTGHSADGTVFVAQVPGASNPVIVSGDALFAGSVGGIRVADESRSLRDTYRSALAILRREILSPLPSAAVILPGHGPVTTIERERKRNPFF